MSPRVLIVGCGFPQLGLLRFARQLGLGVCGADLNPNAVGVELCDTFRQVSTTDVQGLIEVARELGVSGITSAGSEAAIKPVALACEALGLPFYAQSSLLGPCQHKDQQRAALRAGGAPSPAFSEVADLTQARAFAAEHGLPVVVKPARGWGQRGVSVVQQEGELEPAVAAALEAAARVPDLEGAPVCLIEDFIEGQEYSVNAYTRDGETEVLSVTERIITSYPDPPGITFAEVYPSGLDSNAEAEVVAAALAGIAALGISRGPTYTQLRHGPKGAFIVETAYRLGGGLDPDVAFLASGKSLYRRILGVALGRSDWESHGPEAPAHGGAIGRFLIAQPGRVREIGGLNEARGLSSVVDAQVYVRAGGEVFPLTDGSKRAGHVLATGTSRADAEANANRGAELIQIRTETM